MGGEERGIAKTREREGEDGETSTSGGGGGLSCDDSSGRWLAGDVSSSSSSSREGKARAG